MKKTAIFYASKNGATENIAYDIQFAFDEDKDNIDIFNVAEGIESMKQYDNILLGTPTYGVGELHDDWKKVIDELRKMDLSNKTIALFSAGDQILFHESFVNGMGTLYKILEKKDVKIIGKTSIKGYNFEESTAVRDGEFVGLAIDDMNQAEQSLDRIADWVEEIKKYL